MNENQFGFLQVPLQANFLGVSLSPLDNHAERLAAIKKESNKDGFYYPPQICEYSIDLIKNNVKNKIEQSEKPATVYPFISSHRIKIENPISTIGEPTADEAAIIYLLAFIYGTRLQPSQWRFEGRIPIKSQHNIYIADDTCLHFLEHVYGWWRKQSVGQRQKFVNVLYVYTRAISLEWDWDMFVHQYMVFDALYNLHLGIKPKLKAHTQEKI